MFIESATDLSPESTFQIDNCRKTVTTARFALSSAVLPLVTEAMIFAELARFEVSRNRAGNSHSPAFSGKSWNAETESWEPLKNHEHAHFFVTDEDGDGRIDHLTVFAPCGFNRDDAAALGQIRAVKRRGNLPPTRLVLIGLGQAADFANAPVFRRARIWRSVTPFSLPYFPNRGGGKPARPRDLPEGQLARELQNRGLPQPVRVERTSGYETGKRPAMRWLEFHHERLRKAMRGNGLYGFEIEFAEPIAGVISLGFGCHFGLGLFLPVGE